MAGRTITRRRISAVGWQQLPDGRTVGLIRVEVTQTDDDTQTLGTKYYMGAVEKSSEPYKDAKAIIDTGYELPKAWIKALSLAKEDNAKSI